MANRTSSNKRIGWTGVPRKEREEKVWEQRFQELAAYKRRHGHCNIPPPRSEDPLPQRQLATWVVEQRRRRRQGKMSPNRFARLNEIGVDWNRRKSRPDEMWSVMYGRMKAYKKKYGDCLVPQRFAEDIKLGRWVTMQRSLRKSGVMSKMRQEKLERIGFVWDAEDYLPPNILKGKRRQARAASGARKRLKKSRLETPMDFEIGTLVMKYFDGDGWFLGEITSNTAGYRVVYEDGDREFYTLDSEQLIEMVDSARDVTEDELLLVDPDADDSYDTETGDDEDDLETEEENEAEEEDPEEEEGDVLLSRETPTEQTKAEEELFATTDDDDEDYMSALEELETNREEDKEERDSFSELQGIEEEAEAKERAPTQSRLSQLQCRVLSFFGSKTK